MFRMLTVKGYRHYLLFPAALTWLLVMDPPSLVKITLMFPCQRWHKLKPDRSVDITILKHLNFFVLSVPHDENMAGCAFKNLLV